MHFSPYPQCLNPSLVPELRLWVCNLKYMKTSGLTYTPFSFEGILTEAVSAKKYLYHSIGNNNSCWELSPFENSAIQVQLQFSIFPNLQLCIQINCIFSYKRTNLSSIKVNVNAAIRPEFVPESIIVKLCSITHPQFPPC